MRNDEELMTAYVAGDQGAFRELFARYAPLLARVLARDFDRPSDVEDLVQQTFLHLHRARRDFQAGARLRPWLFTIAFNIKRGYYRYRQRRPELMGVMSPDGDPASSHNDPHVALENKRLREALSRLPEGQRDAVALHWLEGFTFPEIGEILGIRAGAAKVRAHRGYARLREILGDEAVTLMGGSAYS